MYLGYSVALVPYARAKRVSGRSQWTFTKRLKYFQDMIVASSDLIPKSATVGGAIISFLGISTATALSISLLLHKIELSDYIAGVGIGLLTLATGVVVFLLGQIGEYLWRIHEEIVDRPIFLIDQLSEKASD